MRLGVILSMKRGIDHFTYRELLVYGEAGIDIELFPTKFQAGLYNAKENWRLHRWHPLWVILAQPLYFFRSPLRYFSLFLESLKFRAAIDFFIAEYFAVRMKEIDVIYSISGDRKLFIGYFCKKILKKPQMVILHAYELYRNPNPRLFVHALNACDQIITVTDYNRELLFNRFHIDPASVEVVRCSVDTDDYKPEKKFVILIVSQYDERKGHEILLRAVKSLNYDDIEVWIVGGKHDRPNEVNVPELVKELGLESKVALFGSLSGTALKAMYRSCDVFCLPSRTSTLGIAEGFPVVLMEAMSFGKPVITTRHVEIPRVVPEVLVNENDVDGLADAIRKLYGSRELLKTLGERNRTIAEKLFSLSNAEASAHLLNKLAHPD